MFNPTAKIFSLQNYRSLHFGGGKWSKLQQMTPENSGKTLEYPKQKRSFKNGKS